MRITKVSIPKEEIHNGLECVEMDRLGEVVLLAGKNGSGKTRLLNLIQNKIQEKPNTQRMETLSIAVNNIKKGIEDREKTLEGYLYNIKLTKTDKEKDLLKQKIISINDNIETLKNQLENEYKSYNWKLIETDSIYNNYSIFHFIPKKLDIKDPKTYRERDIDITAKEVNKIGVEALDRGAFSRILQIQNRWFNATHQYSEISDNDKQQIVDEYNNLKNLISLLLNTELSRDLDSNPTIFGLPLGDSSLSDGQKVLIQLCIALHCQKQSLENIILFLDEPENHLHPSVIIEIVERILGNLKNGQVWIATHSIELLSHFDPSFLWFMEHGKVSYAGKIPEKVLESLLGDEERIEKLQDFINLPALYAMNRYAYECLFEPISIKTRKNDPQILQIKSEIKRHLLHDKKIRILDYGAGKGRFLTGLIEDYHDSIDHLNEQIDYIAFDPNKSDKEECLNILRKLYDNPEKRYFNELSDLNSVYDNESFDIVLMCNVLHEIDPIDWLETFKIEGYISDLLGAKGIVLIVEDHEIPIGEKAYQKGFIVLDTNGLKELFAITEQDDVNFYSDYRGDGRLKAHMIKKEYLSRITNDTRIKAIKAVHKTAEEKIKQIRNDKVSYRNGKKHGFWIQQYANSKLALNELTT